MVTPPMNQPAGTITVIADSLVAAGECRPVYPPPPYSPGERFPEYGFDDIAPENNEIYCRFRQMLRDLQLDTANYGTPLWNPFAGIVRPGDHVVVKPNLVRHFHGAGLDMHSMITHASVLRPIIDYIFRALAGRGQVCICDAPVHDADFLALLELSGIAHLVHYYAERGLTIRTLDLRDEQVILDENRHVTAKTSLPGDPLGCTVVDLGSDSHFDGLAENEMRRLYGTLYDRELVHEAHASGVHKYAIANTILDADVIFMVAKVKTHHKAGVSLALKNAISIAPRKQWLPHCRVGAPSQGGDEYPDVGPWRMRRAVQLSQELRFLPRVMRPTARRFVTKSRALAEPFIASTFRLEPRRLSASLALAGTELGAWSGNDTVWRMVLDLNRILFYAKKTGELANTVQRRYFCVLDGIIAGEGNGPLSPLPRPAGLLLAGRNPVAVDIATSQLMGLSFGLVRHIAGAFARHRFPLVAFDPDDVSVVSGHPEARISSAVTSLKSLAFQPPSSWQLHFAKTETRQDNHG